MLKKYISKLLPSDFQNWWQTCLHRASSTLSLWRLCMYTAHQRIMARLNSLNSFVDTHGDGRMQQTLVGGGGVEKKKICNVLFHYFQHQVLWRSSIQQNSGTNLCSSTCNTYFDLSDLQSKLTFSSCSILSQTLPSIFFLKTGRPLLKSAISFLAANSLQVS